MRIKYLIGIGSSKVVFFLPVSWKMVKFKLRLFVRHYQFPCLFRDCKGSPRPAINRWYTHASHLPTLKHGILAPTISAQIATPSAAIRSKLGDLYFAFWFRQPSVARKEISSKITMNRTDCTVYGTLYNDRLYSVQSPKKAKRQDANQTSRESFCYRFVK